MAKTVAILLGVAVLFGAGTAAAACAYEGQRYPAGTVLCISGKIFVCQSNDAWKVDRSSTCSN
jgi:hypothetical protein